MKVLIISSSPRKGGNSELLARAFAQGLQQKDHVVTMISAGHMKINGCLACDQCYAEADAPCVQKDDFWKIYPMLLAADMVVLVSPLYFFNLTAQLKAVIDRMYAFCRSNHPMPLVGKKSVLLMTGASSDLKDFLPAIDSYKLTADYLKWQNKGVFIASDVWKKDDILESGWLEQVLAFGQSF
ncbi:flavodoxin family protein [Eubacterium maltosivorans]|nr:flavodoxin family protein [Eubacterium maltosivorans]